LLLQDDGRIVLGALPETLPDKQMVKLDQRCLHHARGAPNAMPAQAAGSKIHAAATMTTPGAVSR
jgi:hypothetical protein